MVSLVEKNTHTLTDWRIDDSLESVQLNGRDRDVVGVMIENGKQQQQKTAQENDRITSERR